MHLPTVSLLAQGRVPADIAAAMALSQMTALLKPNGRVRGIAVGDTFRRLVAKTLARQFQEPFREAVAPFNFGLSDRSGTDGVIHLVRTMCDLDLKCTLVSIDSIGAYDYVSQAHIL